MGVLGSGGCWQSEGLGRAGGSIMGASVGKWDGGRAAE